MPNDGVGTDLPFLNQKMQPGQDTLSSWLGRLDEQAAHAHVPHAGDILASVALPVDPYIPGRWDARR